MEKSSHIGLQRIILILVLIFTLMALNAETPKSANKDLEIPKSLIQHLKPTPDGIIGYYDGFGDNILMVENMAFISAPFAMKNGVVSIYEFDGSSWNETAKIMPPTNVLEPLFGFAMDYAGNQLVIGAPGEADNEINTGSVYIFTHVDDSWVLSQKINANDSAIGDRFGYSISLTDNHLLVGAPAKVDEPGTSGAIYAFAQDGGQWTETQKITLDSSTDYHAFGKAIASYENKLIAIAENYKSLNHAGVFNAFEFNGNWQITQQFVPKAFTSSHFGSDIEMTTDKVIIGDSYQYNEADSVRSGAVFNTVYDSINQVWLEPEPFYHDTPELGDYFGASLNLSGNKLVVGASRKNTDVNGAGVIYVFELLNNDWFQSHQITDINNLEHSRMGSAVAIKDDLILSNTSPEQIGLTPPVETVTPFRLIDSTFKTLQPIKPQNASKNDHFGSALSIDNQHLFVGAYLDWNEHGVEKGSVSVYKHVNSEWQLSQKLTPNDPDLTDTFGRTLAHDKNTLMVGASFSSGFDSAVYVFENIGGLWTEVQKIASPEGQSLFGWSISIDDEIAFIAQNNKVHIYEKLNNTWSNTDFITLPGFVGTPIRVSTDLSGNTAVIGVKHYIDIFNPETIIFVYEKIAGVWSLKQTISPINPDEELGSPKISESKILFGASDSNSLINTGYVYIYDYDGSDWVLEDTVTPLNAADGDHFGSSIQYTDNLLIIGASGDDEMAENSGAVYIYQKTDNVWDEIQKIKAPDAALNDYFGQVSMNQQGVIAISASADDASGTDSGSVYLTGQDDLIFKQGF